MRKQLLSVVAFIFGCTMLWAQTVDMGRPMSWSGKIPPVKSFMQMPHVDVAHQLYIDSLNKANGLDKMLRFGYEHHVDIDVFQSGQTTVTPKGDRITLFGIECKNALSINVIFDEFELAEGTLLHLYDDSHSYYIGAHTAANNNANRMLGTELIKADRMIIEVFEPAGVVGQSRLLLGTIVHGYLNLDEIAKALNDSGNCNIDVNCPQGAGWEMQRNSVAMMVSGGGFCTGSLVHNTSGNIIPYFISANHCGTNPGGWTFRFRWESPVSGVSCATTANSANGPTTMNVNGGVLRANNSNADFTLTELNTAPNPAWGIYYNGWDATDATTITRTTGIHHPSGDIKKICHSLMAPSKQTVNFNGNPNAQMWNVPFWTEGVTEPGSSGSPLFDQNGRVVGVLAGGAAACTGGGSGTSNNGQYDIYGRFGVAWNALPQTNNQLKHWLDPNNTGSLVIDGVDPAAPSVDYDAALSNLQGVDNVVCGPGVGPSVTLTNSGQITLTSATIVVNHNGSVTNIPWTGSLNTNQNTVVTIPFLSSNNGNNNLTITVTNPNGQADQNPANDQITKSYISVQQGEFFQMDLTLDCYADEITWRIVDGGGNIWYSGGGYELIGNTTQLVQETFCLLEGCYNLIIEDSYGDGLNGSIYSQCDFDGSMTLRRTTNNQIVAELLPANSNFGSTISFPFCAANLANITMLELAQSVALYPNPTRGMFTVDLPSIDGVKSVRVIDVTGKEVITQLFEGNSLEVDGSFLRSGVYFVNVVTSYGIVTKKLVIE
jgi:lysyl endopeptidase